MLLISVALAGCNTRGVNGFAANGSVMAIVEDGALYIVEADGSQRVYLGVVSNAGAAAVLSNDGGTVYYIDRFSNRVVAAATDGSHPLVRMSVDEASGDRTVLAVLPSSELFFFDERGNTNRYFAKVIDPFTTETVQQIEDIEGAFLNASALRLQPDSTTGEWILAPITGPGQVQMVFQADGFLFHYEIDDTLEFVETLPRALTEDDVALLQRRVPNDIASAVLTDDVRYMVIRTREGTGSATTFGLYALSLMDDTPATPLVEDARVAPEFAIDPNGTQVVFEVPGTPRTMIAYEFASGDFEPLEVGAFDPTWWR